MEQLFWMTASWLNRSIIKRYFFIELSLLLLLLFLVSCILLQNLFGIMSRPILMTEGHFLF